MPTPVFIPYPPDASPQLAADFARSHLDTFRGARHETLLGALEAFDQGHFQDALEILQPLLRYNPGTAASMITAKLYHRWQYVLPMEKLEPHLERWLQWLEHRPKGVAKAKAMSAIQGTMERIERLQAGKSESPGTDWEKVMNYIGKCGTDVLDPRLWPEAKALALHIARTRLRNPNVAPTCCLGRGLQPQGAVSF